MSRSIRTSLFIGSLFLMSSCGAYEEPQAEPQEALQPAPVPEWNEKDDDPSLAALGLLTVGPRFRNNLQEQISDRITPGSRLPINIKPLAN